MSLRRPGHYVLSIIAETGERFSDFQPYVASINDEGVVAFQASLRRGGSGVYLGSGASIWPVVETTGSPLREVVSHPDVSGDGTVCFYADTESGGGGVFVVRGGELITIADSHGPNGPTVNSGGAIAFRAAATSDTSGIFRHVDGVTTVVARTAEPFTGFQGLPVINSPETVVFRADLVGGGQGIYLADGDGLTPAVETGERFSDLGLFPILADDRTVAFAATLRSGSSGVFTAREGEIATIIDSARDPFDSFRGALLNSSDAGVFYATPRGGGARLGVFSGPDPVADRVLAIGSPLLGSTVTDFALNPVSINRHGQLAIRVRLVDDRQYILRADLRSP